MIFCYNSFVFNFLQGESEYEEWKYHKNKNIVEVIGDFSSLTIPAALLLTQLPRLQPVVTYNNLNYYL